MADDPVLPATGIPIAGEDDGSRIWQKIKIAFGVAGTRTLVSSTNPLPVAAGGYSQSVRSTPTVDATPDYSDGDSMHSVASLTVGRLGSGANNTGRLTGLTIKSLAAITVGYWVYLFDSNPNGASSAFTRNSALAIDAADKTRILKSIYFPAGSFVLQGNTGVYQAEIEFSRGYALTGSQTIYLAAEADGTINLASSSDIEYILDSEND